MVLGAGFRLGARLGELALLPRLRLLVAVRPGALHLSAQVAGLGGGAFSRFPSAAAPPRGAVGERGSHRARREAGAVHRAGSDARDLLRATPRGSRPRPARPARPGNAASQAVREIDRKWWVLAAVGTGTFMSALDGSVVNSILPLLRTTLETDVATIEWVVTVYLLVVSGLLLGFGRLGDLRGHKSVYITGLVGFVTSSALCGLSPSVAWLIGARGVQAISAAMLFANSPAILTSTFPGKQRGQALGLQALMTYLGLTTGPSLGGLLAQHVGWRSVFYINVPVGAVALFLSGRFIERDAPQRDRPPFDTKGAALFFLGLLALLVALNKGHAWGWTSPWVFAMVFCSAALLFAFVRREKRVAHPMLDLRLFARRAFSSATVSAILNYVCVYGIVFLVPFYLIQGRGLKTGQAGALLTAQPLAMMVSAPISGTLSDRIGVRIPAVAGMAVLACGLFLLSRVGD